MKDTVFSQRPAEVSPPPTGVKECIDRICGELGVLDISTESPERLFQVLTLLVLQKQRQTPRQQELPQKKLLYSTMELLPGRLLGNNLRNLGLYSEVAGILRENGRSLPELEELEAEANVGNGGLGRLAACFLSSAASLGFRCDCVTLRYHFGLGRQVFEGLAQTEQKDPWIKGNPWLNRRDNLDITVTFGSTSHKVVVYDMPVYGAGPNGVCNTVHLIDLECTDESLSPGKGIGFDKDKTPENLTLFLYPADGDRAGKLIRLEQEYLLSSAGVQILLHDAARRGVDPNHLYDYYCVQINDTHPALSIPELIRLLMENGVDFDRAFAIARKTFSYTNHTVMSEALERWDIGLMRSVMPEIVDIICRIEAKLQQELLGRNLHVVSKNQVHMANLCVFMSHKVNSVAALHRNILKNTLFREWDLAYPDRIINVTNGIDHRRWLLQANMSLTEHLKATIGDDFAQDPSQLQKLLDHREDEEVLRYIGEAKQVNKRRLVESLGLDGQLNTNFVFVVQAKRFHLYKRQQMTALWIIRQYLNIKSGKHPPKPISVIFAGKAHPSYGEAKDVITLLLALEKLTAEDSEVAPWLRVVVLENYNVTLAEKLIPAADVSLQISLAGYEASGTGNMKLAMNGAITVGTMDGANIEIHERVGDDSMFVFGMTADEAAAVAKTYDPAKFLSENSGAKEVVQFVSDKLPVLVGESGTEAGEALNRAAKTIMRDQYMSLLDLPSFAETMDKMLETYSDQNRWNRMALTNIACSGWFSSDRSIGEYNSKIWQLRE